MVVSRAEIDRIAARLEMIGALEAEMHAKVGAGEIRSLTPARAWVSDQITRLDSSATGATPE